MRRRTRNWRRWNHHAHKPEPHQVIADDGATVGSVFRGERGIWAAAFRAPDAQGVPRIEMLPGRFKSRKTAVAAALRAYSARMGVRR